VNRANCTAKWRCGSDDRGAVNRFRRVLLALAVCWICPCGPAFADGLLIITHPEVTLSPDDVRDVFLGEKQIANGITLVPVDNASAQSAFLTRVMKLDAAKYAASWTKKAFRDGVKPPALKANDVEVIEYVRHIPGAVSYVSAPPGAGVNIVKMR
jgi:hypothetical protein